MYWFSVNPTIVCGDSLLALPLGWLLWACNEAVGEAQSRPTIGDWARAKPPPAGQASWLSWDGDELGSRGLRGAFGLTLDGALFTRFFDTLIPCRPNGDLPASQAVRRCDVADG